MSEPFHTALRNLYSSVANARTIRRSVPQSSAWAKLRIGAGRFSPRFPIRDADARVRGADFGPIQSTRRGNWRRPKSFSIANACFANARGGVSHHPGLVHRPHEPVLRESGQAYPPKHAFFGLLFSCPHRSRAAPPFRRLDTLTVQDRRTGFRVSPLRPTHFLSQLVMNRKPSSVEPPIPKVSVDGLPRWQVMRQHGPLATGAKDIENGIYDFAPCMFSRTTAEFDMWY